MVMSPRINRGIVRPAAEPGYVRHYMLDVLSAAIALGEWLLLGTFPRAIASRSTVMADQAITMATDATLTPRPGSRRMRRLLFAHLAER